MSIEDKIEVVMIGENPNFTAEELKAEIIKKNGVEKITMLATTINKTDWVDEFRKYTRGLYSLEACQSIFDDLINWQEKIGEDWVKNLTYYDVQMIYTEYKTLEEFIEDYQLEGVKTIEEINDLDSMIKEFKEVTSIAKTERVLLSDFCNHWKNY